MKPTVQLQHDLASYAQVSLLIYQLLSAAQAGGMTESMASTFFDDIQGYFGNIPGAAFWSVREELIRVLMLPDEAFTSLDNNAIRYPWKMN